MPSATGRPTREIKHLSDLDDQWLLRTHFFGLYREEEDGTLVLPNPQKQNEVLPADTINEAIQAAIDALEDNLQVSIRTYEQREEFHDYDRDLWNEYSMMDLDKYPVIKVHSLTLQYGEGSDAQVLWEVPSSMLQIHGQASLFGTLQILPQVGAYMGANGVNPLLFSGILNANFAPSFFKVVYDAGLDGLPSDPKRDALPSSIVRAIGLQAAIHPLNILGDLQIGAGIASMSVSVDGISRSVNTTASAENSAFSSRIIQYHKELRGDQNTQGLIPSLQAKWRRVPMALL